MSARMLQRALRTQKLANHEISTSESGQEQEQEGEGEGEGESEDLRFGQTVGNSFDLLGIPDDVEEVEEQDALSDDPKHEEMIQNKAKPAKKKKKKKGKKLIVSSEEPRTEDMDQILKGLSVSETGSSSSHSSMKTGGSWWLSGAKSGEVLTVDTKYLRAEDELKRIFGSKVINAVERGNETNLGGLRRRQGMIRKNWRGSVLRRTTLVTSKDYWLPWDGSLSMELTERKDGMQYFKYTYSSSYVETQRKYEASGASYDPNIIAMVLAHHPYHVKSLLALAEVYKQLGDYQQSVECLERSLFALECAWHPLFNPFNGTCRLPFSSDTNKDFFFALSKHMQHLGRRGCHRSALEVCKLLLLLDPEDPLGALFSIDYFALRAEQFEWLEHFTYVYSNDSSLALLPNFSFSLAVAKFHLEAQKARPSVETPAAAKGQAVSSLDLLKQALMLHPATLCKIVEKAPIKQDVEWKKVLRHSHFKKANPGGPSLEHLVNLYVERNYLIWRVPELQVWLKTASLNVLEAVDRDSAEAANWACVRQEAFPSQTNEYRHLHVSEFSDSAPALPPEELEQMMFQGDGGDIDRPNAFGHADHNHQEHVLEERNALLVFLQSMLPWTDYGEEPSPIVAAPQVPDNNEEH